MNIYLVRHGETAKNREKRLQGRSNAPLNESGIAQAEGVKDFFAKRAVVFDRVYSSPLGRAEQTARIIVGENADIRLDDLLLEMDYGPYEGSSLEHPAPELLTFFSDFVHNPAPEGMESLAQVTQRMGSFLERLKTEKAENVLVTTHAIAMKGALEYLTPDAKGAYWSKYIGTCAVYHTQIVDGVFSIPREILGHTDEPGV